MRFLEFIEKVDEDILLEAAKDRYLQMFQNMPEFIKNGKYMEFNGLDERNAERVEWAMQTFNKKSNAVTWWLRWYRLFILKQIASKAVDPEDQEASDLSKKLYTKEVRRTGAKSGLGDSITSYLDTVVARAEMAKFEHFMSLPIPEIINYPFEWQTPYQVVSDFANFEREWQESRRGMVPRRDEHKEVLKFPDGSAWVDLGVAGCEEEGEAMGHCGNAPTQKAGQTVLSYRTPQTDDKGRPAWKPHLTFILDKNDGMIGEMKGRNNQKPDEKYHNVIMELLKQPLIKGIKGGGYKPENNFRLSDLDPEQFEDMLTFKPSLGDPLDQYIYNDRTVSPELVSKLDSILSDDVQIGFDGYDEENDIFILDGSIGSVTDVFENYSGESSELWIDDDDLNEIASERFQEDMGKDTLYVLARYFNKKYPEEDPIKDATDGAAVYDALRIEGDEVIEELHEVIKEYLQESVEASMEQQVESVREYSYDENTTGLYFDQNSDGTYRLVADPESFLETDLPKLMSEGGYRWEEYYSTYFRDPNEEWQEYIKDDTYGDSTMKEYLSNHIAENMKNKPSWQEAMKIGAHPGVELEKKAGQGRLFDSIIGEKR